MIGVEKNTTYFYLNRWKTRLKFKKKGTKRQRNNKS